MKKIFPVIAALTLPFLSTSCSKSTIQEVQEDRSIIRPESDADQSRGRLHEQRKDHIYYRHKKTVEQGQNS